ncbi:MAG: hypothetical protein H8E15_17030 [Planctomycetes bacterium]|nr:hypothetical protein [Planctomycetota bacterium]
MKLLLSITISFLLWGCGKSENSNQPDSVESANLLRLFHELLRNCSLPDLRDTPDATPSPLAERKARIMISLDRPESGLQYRVTQHSIYGRNRPGTRLQFDSGVTDGNGELRFQLHPHCARISISVVPDGEPPVFVFQKDLKVSQVDLGNLILPPIQSIHGKVNLSARRESKPKRLWVWDGHSAFDLPSLNLLPDGILLHGLDEDYLEDAAPIEAWRNEGDLRLGQVKPIEIQFGMNFDFILNTRFQYLVFCVQDQNERFHFGSMDTAKSSKFEMALIDPGQAVIQLVDENGKPAADAQIATPEGGSSNLLQILRPCGSLPTNGMMKVSANAGEFVTIAARWQDGDPWYTFNWMDEDTVRRSPTFPSVLARPKQFTVYVEDENEQAVTVGRLVLVSGDFLNDPQNPAFYFQGELNEDGAVVIPRLPPINGLIAIHESGVHSVCVDWLFWNPEDSQAIAQISPHKDLEVRFEGELFNSEFFPARVSLDKYHSVANDIRWIESTGSIVFPNVRCEEQVLEVEGANGADAICGWDGKSDFVVFKEHP